MGARGYFLHYVSRYTGHPCVAIVTMESANPKIGNIPQVWFLPARVSPLDAIRNGSDAAICGNCPLRANGCYVVACQAPQTIHKAFKRGAYAPIEDFSDPVDLVRLGAYGDPGSMSYTSFGKLMHFMGNPVTLGYTQSWPYAPWLRKYCMASARTVSAAAAARRARWRSFRMGHERVAGEVFCAGDCTRCKACRSDCLMDFSVFIRPHGARASRALAYCE